MRHAGANQPPPTGALGDLAIVEHSKLCFVLIPSLPSKPALPLGVSRAVY